jgi:hypothetical protein
MFVYVPSLNGRLVNVKRVSTDSRKIFHLVALSLTMARPRA